MFSIMLIYLTDVKYIKESKLDEKDRQDRHIQVGMADKSIPRRPIAHRLTDDVCRNQ
jgi:hypothetical protein